MAQRHRDRLSATDATFLHREGESSHMHIGGALVCEGPAPTLGELLVHIRGRLHLVPRYRQKLATPPRDLGRPVWVDDNDFTLGYHVRRVVLPPPGGERELQELIAGVASQPLDRSRPLWECWLVAGLEAGGTRAGGPEAGGRQRTRAGGPEAGGRQRFALVFKNHHALFDGISGIDLATVLFDLTPEPALREPGLEPWRPQQEPTPADLLAGELRAGAGQLLDLGAGLLDAARRPSRAVAQAQETLAGLNEIVRAALDPAPETPLNVPIGPRRRFTVVRQRLDEYKAVKNHFGGTVNDVVLSVVSGALAHWSHARGLATDGVEMRALVPVSIRAEDEHHTLGNRLTLIRGPLPLYMRDPVGRLQLVREAMAGLKDSRQAVGASTLVAAGDLAPPAVLAQASRLQFSTRLFNLIVTNIPGPQLPLYVLGRRLEDMFPVAFLPENQALAVAIVSYDGQVEYGLLGDFDTLPDIEVIAEGVELALQELVDAAGAGDDGGGRVVQPESGRVGAARSINRP
jgi:WS/DGAT/MGAT family acyltransferase